MKSSTKIAFLATATLATFFTACPNANQNKAEGEKESVFALVNIPFEKFFAQETEKFDAYSSATQKAANGSIAYGTYHKDSSAEADKEKTFPANQVTAGITYPVKI